MSQEGLSPIEADLVKNNEGNFRNTLNTLAAHAEEIIIEQGEDLEGTPETQMLMVLREGSYDPSTIRQTTVSLGLDGTVQAVVTQEGSGIIVTAPLSPGRLGEIFDAGLENNDSLVTAIAEVRDQAEQQGRGIMDRTMREITEMIARPDNWRNNPEVGPVSE